MLEGTRVVDINDCEREPIHIPGASQPFGVLLALDGTMNAAQGSENVLYPLREALARLATVGEVCGVLREAWGEYRPEVRL